MKIVIGSRGSKLAVAQTEWVADQLRRKNPELEIELKRITTTGDQNMAASLQAIGGKGVFVKEIEDALLRKEIDLAVHSSKDMPQDLPGGLMLGPAPAREDPRDAVISRFGEQLGELPRGSTIGTSSPRRRAQILYRHGNRKYTVKPLRGNIDTRVRKVKDGEYDAVVLAYAGLLRAGLADEVSQILEPDEMLPAAGQGCLALELREADTALLEILQSIRDHAADITLRAERAFLQGLGGDCFVPVGAYSKLTGDELHMQALLLDIDGTRVVRSAQSGPADAAELVGGQLAERVLYDGGSELLSPSEPPNA